MYSEKAYDILDSSINSVVFIDEKAKDFFSNTPINPDIPEEKLSVDLFNTFKENGKNLSIHKFETSTLESQKTLDYLLNGKDLILLDWELDEVSGQEHSLNLLSKIVATPFINFCCIYSSSANFDQIPLMLNAYFSGVTKEEYDLIKNTYSHIELKDIEAVLGQGTKEIATFFKDNEVDRQQFPIERLRNKPLEGILNHLYNSFNSSRLIFPSTPLKEHDVLNNGNDSFIVNNTFVLTLKKELEQDSDYKKLLKRISDIIIKNKGSFFQLLGMEMQSVFNSNERFIDETILKSSTEALFQFRNHINDDKEFGIVIKKLLIEQATLKLRTAKLKLLDTEFMEYKSEQLKGKAVSHEDLFQLNVFHNAVTVKSLNPDSLPNLNFGDVFVGKDKDYYICITALCDCYNPVSKIQNNFYFAKGSEFKNIELALKLGDTGFLSFLPNQKVVQWGNIESAKKVKLTKGDDETEDQFKYRKCQSEIEAYKTFLYKPFYIKPKVFYVENNKLIDNKIRLWEYSKPKKSPEKDNMNYYDVEYVTTLRDDYTQRIANHAFGHPSRVGVNFVKL